MNSTATASDPAPTPTPAPAVSTGSAGLDEILGGGLPENRLYLVEGESGAGKTTLALQFLLEGVRRGEPAVYVALSETEEELHDIALSHGWSLDGITICTLSDRESQTGEYTFFHPADVELEETTRGFLDVIREIEPRRVVFDSLSELRLLTRDSLRFRRQILSLKTFLAEREATTLLVDHPQAHRPERQLESLVHGVLQLEQHSLQLGGRRRQLLIRKIRGLAHSGGYYDYVIRTGSLEVFPRLPSGLDSGIDVPDQPEQLSSDVPQLDGLTGGGLDHGTTNLLVGPAGSGKSTLATHYLAAALRRGDPVLVILFEETLINWRRRAYGLGLDLRREENEGRLHVLELDPAQMFPGELADTVRRRVEDDGVRLVILDSINGYHHAMPEPHSLTMHLHELFNYLNNRGVVSLVVASQHGLLSDGDALQLRISYLADTVVLFRYFEAFGQVRRAIAVIKKRTGNHERTIRELLLTAEGVRVGERLEEFQGVLGGPLEYLGGQAPLLDPPEEDAGGDA